MSQTLDEPTGKSLYNILRAYSVLVSPKTLAFPSNLPFTVVHDFILHSILLSRHLQRYPPSINYQLRFWKWVIYNLEGMIGDQVSLLDWAQSRCDLIGPHRFL